LEQKYNKGLIVAKEAIVINLNLTDTNVFICFNSNAYSKVYNSLVGDYEDLHTDGVTTEIMNTRTKKISYIIGLQCDFDTYDLINTKALLVHELSHLVTMHMKVFNFNCDEFRSVLLQHLYLETIPALDNYYDKKNNTSN
jgi:hypothetical protein